MAPEASSVTVSQQMRWSVANGTATQPPANSTSGQPMTTNQGQ